MSLDVDTVVFLEGGEGDEVSVQEHIEGFHDLQPNVSLWCNVALVW